MIINIRNEQPFASNYAQVLSKFINWNSRMATSTRKRIKQTLKTRKSTSESLLHVSHLDFPLASTIDSTTNFEKQGSQETQTFLFVFFTLLKVDSRAKSELGGWWWCWWWYLCFLLTNLLSWQSTPLFNDISLFRFKALYGERLYDWKSKTLKRH